MVCLLFCYSTGRKSAIIDTAVRFDATFVALYCLASRRSSNNDAYTIMCESSSIAKLNMVWHSLFASHAVSLSLIML